MVGGSVAGSTAGWWPSDRDRFPPRFLLPPSLQTHNCIISTHLPAPLFVPPTRSPTHQPPSTAFLQSLPLHVLSRSFHRHGPLSLSSALLAFLFARFFVSFFNASSTTSFSVSSPSFSLALLSLLLRLLYQWFCSCCCCCRS